MATRASSSTVVLFFTVIAALTAVPRHIARLANAAPAPQAQRAAGVAPAADVGTSLERTGSALLSEYLAAGRPLLDATRCDRKIAIAHSVVVILPDPLDSHLDWAFDSGLESVRRAMENSRYVLDRYWLPWTVDTDTVHKASDHLGNSLRTRAPGVLLFRSAASPRDSVALVYLVGETPTRGIHAAAFRAATADRDSVFQCRETPASAAVKSDDTLRVVGPVFSGSARSLRDVLDDWHAGRPNRQVLIISGGATAGSNKSMLSGCPPLAPADSAARTACTAPTIRFFATVNTVTRLKNNVERMLRDNFGVEPGEIAYLNESGTLFGQTLRDTTTRTEADPASLITLSDSIRPDTLPLQIPFPMNISRLRREYARRPSAADTLGGGEAARTRLEWKDPASASESPSPLSALTAPTMERTIADIEQTLRMHRIRAVGILATDVRDRLFLASVVRERLRDVKVFLIGSHALYLRPEVNEQLRGTLVVSTYPLFIESQFWDLTQNEDRQRLVFTSDIAEGTYNAMLRQVGGESHMIDYGYPFQTHGVSYPPVWITVVGATAQLPLIATRVNNDTRREDGYVAWRDAKETRSIAERVIRDWDDPIITAALLLGMIAIFSNQLVATAKGLRNMTLKARGLIANTVSAPTPVFTGEEPVMGAAVPVTAPTESQLLWSLHGAELLQHRRSWTIFRFAAVVCAFSPLVLILARPQMHGDVRSVMASVLLLVIVTLTFASAITALWFGRMDGDDEDTVDAPVAGSTPSTAPRPSDVRLSIEMMSLRVPKERIRLPVTSKSQHVSLILLALVYLFVTAWFIINVVTLDRAIAAMFFMRALHLSSGVTPLVPMIVGGVILVAWSTWHIKRVELLGEVSAFEAACMDGRIDAERIARPHQPREKRLRDRARIPGTRDNFRISVQTVRSGLLNLMPERSARFIMLALVLFAFWITVRFQRTLESAVLGFRFPASWQVGDELARMFTQGLPSAFDLLLRFLILTSLGLSAWGLYRMAIVWRGLRHCLLNVEAMPLGNAFYRLPMAVSALARFTPFSAASRASVHLTIDRAAQAIWLELKAAKYDPPISPPRERSLRFRGLRSDSSAFDPRVPQPLVAMHEELCLAARNGDARFFESPAAPDGGAAKPARPRDSYDMVQDLLALYVIDYVEWVMRHLRHLALSLILALALATILISSYPFEPATLIQVSLFTLMIVTVMMVMATLFQMNRNPTLSRIGRTTAGEVTWDRRMVLNLLLIVGVPLITVVGSEFPQARGFLFFWVTPILRAMGKS